MLEAYGSSKGSPSQSKIYSSVFKQERLQKLAKEQVAQEQMTNLNNTKVNVIKALGNVDGMKI